MASRSARSTASRRVTSPPRSPSPRCGAGDRGRGPTKSRSEEHTSELESRFDLVCRLLLEKKNAYPIPPPGAAVSSQSDDPPSLASRPRLAFALVCPTQICLPVHLASDFSPPTAFLYCSAR